MIFTVRMVGAIVIGGLKVKQIGGVQLKKWFKLLSMAVLVASLAACSDDSEPVEENPSESTATEGADVPVMDLSEDKGELTIEDAKEAVEYYALGGNDTLEAMTFEDGHIFYRVGCKTPMPLG